MSVKPVVSTHNEYALFTSICEGERERIYSVVYLEQFNAVLLVCLALAWWVVIRGRHTFLQFGSYGWNPCVLFVCVNEQLRQIFSRYASFTISASSQWEVGRIHPPKMKAPQWREPDSQPYRLYEWTSLSLLSFSFLFFSTIIYKLQIYFRF